MATLTVRLDAASEATLRRLARRRGVTKSEVVREALRALVEREGEDRGRQIRPYDAIAHLIGCARGGPPDLSERTGEGLRRMLHARRARS